ncbi:peroxiredoxin-like family protein [Simiduia litorea]|uniref:peroxiredoxin family protein n=1 Tax=Simiduia litorea TaxID=1435348 RepID=UPI0036F2D01A
MMNILLKKIVQPCTGLTLALCLISGFAVASGNELALPNLPEASKMTAPTQAQLGKLEDGYGLNVGDIMPSFVLKTHTGEPAQSSELLARAETLLVIFYRGGWCPYCNLQIRQLTESYSQFKQRKVLPVLISADKIDAAALAQSRYEIPFPVLSDPDLVAHKDFRVVMSLTPELYETYKGYGIDVEQWSGRDHHQFAVASAFLVDAQGKVKWAHASLDYKQRPSVAQLLDAIDGNIKNSQRKL